LFEKQGENTISKMDKKKISYKNKEVRKKKYGVRER
jgi:hypothetical protein